MKNKRSSHKLLGVIEYQLYSGFISSPNAVIFLVDSSQLYLECLLNQFDPEISVWYFEPIHRF